MTLSRITHSRLFLLFKKPKARTPMLFLLLWLLMLLLWIAFVALVAGI